MTSTVTMYRCDLCENLFGKKEEADRCQKGHIVADNLKVTKAAYLVDSQINPYGYPDFIIVENKKSGSAAKYEIIEEGPVEEIFTEI